MKTIHTILAGFVFTISAGLAHAQDPHAGHNMPAAAAESPMIEGEVRRINKDTGKLTIKHGPLVNLDMPGMTMVFRVKDAAMLDLVKEGEQVRFVADKVDGALTIVKLERATQ